MMRYEIRWANGYWRVFDTFTYSTVRLVGTYNECNEHVKFSNSNRIKG